MELTKEEKHLPEISINWNMVKVVVPSHPAQSKEHFISNISLFQKGELIESKDINFDEEAVLEIELENTAELSATEICNLHWKWDDKWKFLWM